MNVPLRDLETILGVAARGVNICDILGRRFDRKAKRWIDGEEMHAAEHAVVRRWCKRIAKAARKPRRGGR